MCGGETNGGRFRAVSILRNTAASWARHANETVQTAWGKNSNAGEIDPSSATYESLRNGVTEGSGIALPVAYATEKINNRRERPPL